MMAPENLDANLITDVNVQEFFRESVTAALSNQKVDAGEDTVYYIVNLLAYFTQADKLFSHTPEGVTLQPLALIYAEALEAASLEERHQILRRLGDVALLIRVCFLPASIVSSSTSTITSPWEVQHMAIYLI
jgi:hypothetical protein